MWWLVGFIECIWNFILREKLMLLIWNSSLFLYRLLGWIGVLFVVKVKLLVERFSRCVLMFLWLVLM